MQIPGKTDWKLIAESRGMQLSVEDSSRIVPVLESLDAVFPGLAAKLPHEMEPATVLSVAAVAARANVKQR